MMMNVSQFFELFLKELSENPGMKEYYKFLNSNSRAVFEFRKNYFIRRLQYIADHIGKPEREVWDCGCGYGTTALFLAMNNIPVVGSTFEFYSEQIEKRKKYWKQYGDSDLFNACHENIYDKMHVAESHDIIILQDTLHHLEPIDQAFDIFNSSMMPKGKIIVIEENGQNILLRFQLFLYRGNKRIIHIYDDKLGKSIEIGNENVRSLKQWHAITDKHNLIMNDIEYYRMLLQPGYWFIKPELIKTIENGLTNFSLLRNYFYWGLNFTLKKNQPH